MFGLWENSALERYQALKIDKDKLLESHDIVCSAIGQYWFEKQQNKLHIPHHSISDAHPLFRILRSPADIDLIAVCELAEYLRAFLRDGSITQMVVDLKTSKFESTFLELALAYRWLKAGAAVTLRPPTPKGEADFDASIGENQFIVEASIFPADIYSQPLWRLPNIAAETINSIIKKQIPVALKIRIKQFPSGDIEGVLRHSIKNACNALLSQINKESSQPVLQGTDFWTIEIEPITPSTEPVNQSSLRGTDWDTGIRGVEKRLPPEGEPIYRINDQEDERENMRIFIKLPEMQEDPLKRVVKKLIKESRQLHGIRAPRVIILDVTGIARGILGASLQSCRAEILKLMTDTPELACIWLLNRCWTSEFRYQYRGYFITNPRGIYSLPSQFIEKLIDLEHRCDFLGEREIPITSQEEAHREYEARAVHPRGA
jgi:hypothetical protein